MTRPPRRDVWPWWKRAPVRFVRGLYNIFVGPFLTKLPDGSGGWIMQGSMTRCAVAAFTVVECFRLMPQNGPGELRIVPVISVAEAVLAFCILFALPIDAALQKAKPSEVLGLLKSPFARAGEAVDAGATAAVEAGAEVTTTLKQQINPQPEGQ